jgi:hypothetical protein
MMMLLNAGVFPVYIDLTTTMMMMMIGVNRKLPKIDWKSCRVHRTVVCL